MANRSVHSDFKYCCLVLSLFLAPVQSLMAQTVSNQSATPLQAKETAQSSSVAIENAKALAANGKWREALDITWALVAANPFDFEARQILAQSYDALGYAQYAKIAREGFYDNSFGALSDVIGHGGRSAPLVGRKPVEGLKVLFRAGLGADSNPNYAPGDFVGAYQQSFGLQPSSNVVVSDAKSSSYLYAGVGAEYYKPFTPTTGLYFNVDLDGSKHLSQDSANSHGLASGLGIAMHGPKTNARIGLRSLNGRFGTSLGSTTASSYQTLGLAADVGTNFNHEWSGSAGVGIDQASYSDSPSADFRRVSGYLSVTKAWAMAWRPSLQISISGQVDRRSNDTLAANGAVTGPDRRETALTIAGQVRPNTKWVFGATAGFARKADQSPNWSSTTVPYTTQNRFVSSIYASYRWNDKCAIQGRVGSTNSSSNSALYAYDKSDAYLGIACWLK